MGDEQDHHDEFEEEPEHAESEELGLDEGVLKGEEVGRGFESREGLEEVSHGI